MRRFLAVAVMVLSGCVANGNDPTGQSQQRLGGNDQCSDPSQCKTDGNGGTGDPCAQLDATQCQEKSPFCQQVVDCPPCDATTNSDGTVDKTICSERPCVYIGCQSALPADHCVGLSEQACNETSGCQGAYGTVCKDATTNGDPSQTDPTKTDCTADQAGQTGCQYCWRQFSGCHADNFCSPVDKGTGGGAPDNGGTGHVTDGGFDSTQP